MERPWRGQRSEEFFSKNVNFSLCGNPATTQNTFFDIFKSTKTHYGEKKWDQNHENYTLCWGQLARLKAKLGKDKCSQAISKSNWKTAKYLKISKNFWWKKFEIIVWEVKTFFSYILVEMTKFWNDCAEKKKK